VLYGDNNNWFAAWAFWLLKLYGHDDVRLLNGGRRKWIEDGRALTHEPTRSMAGGGYRARPANESIRAFLPEVEAAVRDESAVLIDVRTPAEFRGDILAPPGLAELCQRGGHIPGARNVPWGEVCNDDGTFKDEGALRELYTAHGVDGARAVITYCRIGERSSHSWYVLRYLLGIESVKNYDGSWTEWGNLVRAPIER
jgi:thiosulfate/3-mercaptopyruvate sulfurtransferase